MVSLNVESKLNNQNRNWQIDTENEWWLLAGRRVGGTGEKGEAIKMYQLPVKKTVMGM